MKYLISILILTVLFGLTALQVGKISAAELNISPITSPITYFLVSGRAGYIFNGLLYPAKDVNIKAQNIATNQIFSTKTDNQGRYRLSLQRGIYRFAAFDKVNGQIRFFDPFNKIFNIDRDRLNANFKLQVDSLPY